MWFVAIKSVWFIGNVHTELIIVFTQYTEESAAADVGTKQKQCTFWLIKNECGSKSHVVSNLTEKQTSYCSRLSSSIWPPVDHFDSLGEELLMRPVRRLDDVTSEFHPHFSLHGLIIELFHHLPKLCSLVSRGFCVILLTNQATNSQVKCQPPWCWWFQLYIVFDDVSTHSSHFIFSVFIHV